MTSNLYRVVQELPDSLMYDPKYREAYPDGKVYHFDARGKPFLELGVAKAALTRAQRYPVHTDSLFYIEVAEMPTYWTRTVGPVETPIKTLSKVTGLTPERIKQLGGVDFVEGELRGSSDGLI